MAVVLSKNLAFLSAAKASVFFSSPSYAAFNAPSATKAGTTGEATSVPIAEIITDLNVAPWGEDNTFPQRITAQLNYCGVAKQGLDFKARAIWGAGLTYGTVQHNAKGEEVFTPAPKGMFTEVDKFFEENGNLYRFYLEFLQDWVHFGNCFPELVTSNDRSKIVRLVHQESADVRFRQMDEKGTMDTVFLSKYWADISNQFATFNKKAALRSTRRHGVKEVDNIYVKQLRAIDMYNPIADARKAIEDERRTNIIYPVNYPSPGKTYYQLPVWDGARLAGWLEIASKVPEMLKSLYRNAFNIKYHIEIPDTYWAKRFGAEKWAEMVREGTHQAAKQQLMADMDAFLSGSENAHKAFVSYFDVNRQTGNEEGRIKITVIDNKNNLDKELIASVAANSEVLFAMGLNPDLIGAGAPGGPYSGSAGSGSNIREAWLVFSHLLNIDRKIVVEPLYLIKQFNNWPPELEFRFRDIVLTTLDQNSGTQKIIS